MGFETRTPSSPSACSHPILDRVPMGFETQWRDFLYMAEYILDRVPMGFETRCTQRGQSL